MASFAVAAAGWQNFYLLASTAAATLTGLMFVAVTFGSSLVTAESAPTARSFLDPTFSHFVQVLITGCLVTIPSMSPPLLGGLLLAVAALRGLALVRVFRHMLYAQRKNGDLDLSDWLSGVVAPLLCYLTLAATAVGFLQRYAIAFDGLAVVTVLILLNGVYGAWELMVWMALERSRARPPAAGAGDGG
jgi:hypothetical protein